jgi:hypothetical protein
MMKSLVLIALTGVLSVSAAHAQPGAASTVSIGTTGVGLHLVMPYNDNVQFRAGFNGYSHSTTESTDDATYDISAKLRTFDALVDYFPSAGAFRVTGGLIYNGNKVDLTARPNGGATYTFNGKPYSVSAVGDIHGEMDFNKVAPYLGVGFGNTVEKKKGWGFTADLGVMFQGSPNVNLTSSDCTAGTTLCSQLATDLAAENAELREKAKDFQYYPVVRVGLSYKF